MLLICLPLQFLFDLSASTICSRKLVKLTLVAGFFFLLRNHHFDVVGLLLFLSALHIKSFSSSLFILLGFQSSIPDLVVWSHLRLCNHVFLFFLELPIHCSFHLYVHVSLLMSCLLLLVDINVSLALANDLVSSLSRLIDLFDHLLQIWGQNLKFKLLLLTLPSSILSRPMRLHNSFKSSSARLRATLAATSFLWRVASSSSSYGVKSISSNSPGSPSWAGLSVPL